MLTKTIALVFTLVGCFTIIAPSSSAAGSVGEPPHDELSAEQVLKRVAKTYAGCKTYQDSGDVHVVIDADRNKLVIDRPFKTAFVRPDRFRFEYRQERGPGPAHRHVVWRHGDDVRTWWDLSTPLENPKSLDLALAGATGVSGGCAHHVPALLLPDEISGWRLTDLAEPKRIGDEKLAGADCFRLTGKQSDNWVTLWIDKTTFLMRRFDSTTTLESGRCETTITYDSAIDREVDPESLEFDAGK